MSLSRNLRRSLPLLAALAMPSQADIVQVNGRKYDVKDSDKGPVVTDVLTNSQVSDPQLFFRAVETNLTLESIVKLEKVNGPLALKLLKAHEMFYDSSKPVEAVMERAAELVGSYLAGNKIALDPATAKDTLDYLKTASKDDLRRLLMFNFSRGVEAFERNLKISEGVKDGQTLDERTAAEYLLNDRKVASLPVYKNAIAEDIVNDVKNGTVAKFVEGALRTSDLEEKVRSVRDTPSDDAVLKSVYEENGRATKDINEKQGRTLYKVGRSLVDAGLYKEAIPVMERCVSLIPIDARAHNDLGVAYCGSGNLNRALQEQTIANVLDPSYDEPWLNLSLIYANQGKHKEGVRYAKGYLPIGTNAKRIIEVSKYIRDFDK